MLLFPLSSLLFGGDVRGQMPFRGLSLPPRSRKPGILNLKLKYVDSENIKSKSCEYNCFQLTSSQTEVLLGGGDTCNCHITIRNNCSQIQMLALSDLM